MQIIGAILQRMSILIQYTNRQSDWLLKIAVPATQMALKGKIQISSGQQSRSTFRKILVVDTNCLVNKLRQAADQLNG